MASASLVVKKVQSISALQMIAGYIVLQGNLIDESRIPGSKSQSPREGNWRESWVAKKKRLMDRANKNESQGHKKR